jgi:hypothetical protein
MEQLASFRAPDKDLYYEVIGLSSGPIYIPR